MPSPASHLRAPLLWLLGPLIAGFIAARIWPVPTSDLRALALVALLAGAVAVVLAARPGRVAGIAWAGTVCLSAGFGGFVLLLHHYPYVPNEAERPPREITLTFEVRQTFATSPTGRQWSGVGRVVAAGAGNDDIAGRLVYYSVIRRISIPPQPTGRYVIRGVLEPLPRGSAADDFNDYLANLGVSHRIVRARITREIAAPGAFALFCVRAHQRLEAILKQGLASRPETASTYVAMLLGGKAALTPEQENAYMRSGTFHVFSISGLHVGVIAMAIYIAGTWVRIPRLWLKLLGLPVLWLYVEVTGGSAPAMRSFLMIAAVTIAQSTRLPGNALAGLAAAACLTLLLDPMQLFSTGFQMSYSVVTALLVMGRPLADQAVAAWQPFALKPRGDWRWYHHKVAWLGRHILGAVAAGWTAFLASTPSGIGYFGIFSPGSLLANLLVVPLSMGVIYAGFISLLAGLLGLAPLSAVANLLAALTVEGMDLLLRFGTAIPAMWFPARFRADWLAPASLVLMTAVFLAGAGVRWSPRFGGFWPPAVVLALLVIFGVTFA